ncbi:hypothetical protein ACFVIM_00415 [Streptomyces sp. NPDC057638]|uniref:hypothetical protein n=1 Tax=Streptomyces sp. NPDC057638 TaxID=3346190 RepID=UPI003681BE93
MLITDTAVQETAITVAQNLGGGWVIDSVLPTDGVARLNHPDGRAISFRSIFGGTSVQLWITGTAPTLPGNATAADRAAYEACKSMFLPEGRRYNKATTLITEEDENPDAIILRTLREHLLPAFLCKPHYVGHRPWVEAFGEALDALNDESVNVTPGTSLRACGPEAHLRPHGDDAEPENGNEPEEQPEPELEADPSTRREAGTGNSTDEGTPESPAPVDEPASEVVGREVDVASESAQEPTAEEGDEPPATVMSGRPRKRTTKRHPKVSATG